MQPVHLPLTPGTPNPRAPTVTKAQRVSPWCKSPVRTTGTAATSQARTTLKPSHLPSPAAFSSFLSTSAAPVWCSPSARASTERAEVAPEPSGSTAERPTGSPHLSSSILTFLPGQELLESPETALKFHVKKASAGKANESSAAAQACETTRLHHNHLLLPHTRNFIVLLFQQLNLAQGSHKQNKGK